MKKIAIFFIFFIANISCAGNLIHCPKQVQCDRLENCTPIGGDPEYWPNKSTRGAGLGIYPFHAAVSDYESSPDSKCIYSPPLGSGFASVTLQGNYLNPLVTDTTSWKVIGRNATCIGNSETCPFKP